MIGEAAPRAEEARGSPDAFILPSNTDLRFALLVITVLASALFSFNAVFFAIPDAAAADRAASLACGALAPVGVPDVFTNPLVDPSRFIAAADEFSACIRNASRGKALLMSAGLVLLIGVALALLWMAPARRMRREGFVHLDMVGLPAIATELDRLTTRAGLRARPLFVWTPLDGSSRALAFGRPGREYVGLSGGLVAGLAAGSEVARVIVLHELAHLRNRDVGKTYFALAVWQAFVAVAILPLVLTLPLTGLDPVSTSARLLLLGVLVYLTRNAVLRTREIYADLRVASSPELTSALERALGPDRTSEAWWQRMWRVHPPIAERRAVLHDTRSLFQLQFFDAIVAGVAAGVAVPSVVALAIMVAPADVAQIVAVMVAVPCVVGIIGLGVWRATIPFPKTAPSFASKIALGAGVGAGYLIGQGIALPSVVDVPLAHPTPAGDTVFAVMRIAWAIALVIGTILLVRWLDLTAATWALVATTPRRVRATAFAAIVVAAIVSTLWLSWATTYVVLAEQVRGAETAEDFATFVAIVFAAVVTFPQVQGAAGLAAGIALWATPLSALLVRGDRDLARSARTGLLGAAVYAVMLLLWRVTRLGMPESVRRDPNTILAFFVGQVILALLVVTVVTIAAARRRRDCGAAHGLFAAFACATGSAIAILSLNVAFGGTIDPGFVWSVFLIVVNGATLVAIPVSVLAAWLSGSGARPVAAEMAARAVS